MYGNLDHSNVYTSVGKMDIPVGLNDIVSPFTKSTNWHSFAGIVRNMWLSTLMPVMTMSMECLYTLDIIMIV
tara:strand:- start:256 stop:471 length:216 start_codon:yes stop_codon:yes gene_type:complete